MKFELFRSFNQSIINYKNGDWELKSNDHSAERFLWWDMRWIGIRLWFWGFGWLMRGLWYVKRSTRSWTPSYFRVTISYWDW